MEERGNRTYRLAHLASLLYAGCDLALWCFSKTGKLYYTTSPYEKDLGAFLEIGGCKEFAMTKGKELDVPFVMSDPIGLIWVGEYATVTEGTGRTLVLMGPMFNSETSLRTVDERLRESGISLPMQSTGRHILMHVPLLTIPVMSQYIRMLHFTITEKIIRPDEIIYQSWTEDDPFLTAMQSPPKEKHFMDYEHSYAREQLLLQCIREGNLNYRKITENYPVQSVPDNYMTGDPLREAKDTLIIFASKCSRAAIEGKLSIKAARDIEIHAIRRIERCQALTELTNLRLELLEEYITRVHALKEIPGVSQPIRACCDYIKAHFMEPLELADIAKSVGYTEYYLTRKFQKEMGIRLFDYIRKVRLDYAKIWLISTENSIQDISDQLHFGTRNYFSKVFKEQEGVTPVEYRERARNIAKE